MSCSVISVMNKRSWHNTAPVRNQASLHLMQAIALSMIARLPTRTWDNPLRMNPLSSAMADKLPYPVDLVQN